MPKLFRIELKYRYLRDWSDRPRNSNIEKDVLLAYLAKAGHSKEQAQRAVFLLKTEP